jgi:molecular chaperone GrpE
MARIPIKDDNDDLSAADDAADDANAQTSSEPQQSPPGAAAASGDLDKLRTERDDLYQRLVRTTADFKNAQKRMEGEFDQRLQYANSSLIKSLLPVIDNFERALAVDPAKADAASILKGMQIVHDQWLNVLKSQSVTEIAPKPGDPFNPAHHEALMQQDAPQYAGKGPTVVLLLQKGYGLHDRTLRPAQVAVSRSS